MSKPTTAAKGLQRRSFVWAVVWLVTVIALLGAVVVFRIQAADSDHANANLATYIGFLSVWIVTVACLFGMGRRRMSLAILGGTLAVGLIFLAVFRLERVDGELIPHFASRWSGAKSLPKLEPPKSADPNNLFEPRPTDWPQFLGPNRDSALPSLSIETDWDRHPPKLLWQQPIGEGWSGVAIRGDVGITMEQRDQEEWVSAYDLRDGRLIWKHAIACRHFDALGGVGPRSTPAISSDRVYACSGVSQVVCLDLITGSLIWSQELDQLANVKHEDLEADLLYGRSGSPLVLDATVVVPLGGSQQASASLVALDLQTGELRWRAGDKQMSFASPQLSEISGTKQILYPTKKNLLAIDPNSGKVLWSLAYEGSDEAPNVSQPIILDSNTVFLSKGYGVGARIARVTCAQEENSPAVASEEGGSIVNSTADSTASRQVDRGSLHWEATVLKENRTVLRTKFANAVLHEGHVYGLSDGILECVDHSTLKRKWKQGRYHHGQIVRLANCLLISAEDGRAVLVALDSNEYRELAQLNVISGVTWNPPTISGDRLILRNSSEIACLQLKTLP